MNVYQQIADLLKELVTEVRKTNELLEQRIADATLPQTTPTPKECGHMCGGHVCILYELHDGLHTDGSVVWP